ncbi:uncharacterized protein [Macrobrachium rosenbergii]|uniref:uncharacterized protein n=1 Tax=Macrobrachium rosenbergii TaxID=79674 RepID=UPI0034D4D8AF
MSVSCFPERDGFLCQLGVRGGGGRGRGRGGEGLKRLNPPNPAPSFSSPTIWSEKAKIASGIRSADFVNKASERMAEGIAYPALFFNRESLGLRCPPVAPAAVSSPIDVPRETQPLDFSTKGKKVFDRHTSEKNNNMRLRDSLVGSKSPTTLSRTLESDLLPSAALNPLDPTAVKTPFHLGLSPSFPQSYSHTSASPLLGPPKTSPVPAMSGINALLLAQLQANPLLLSTIQSALNATRFSAQFEPFLPAPNHTPAPANFQIPGSHLHSAPSPTSLLGLNPMPVNTLGQRLLGMDSFKETTLLDRSLRNDSLGTVLGSVAGSNSSPMGSITPMAGLTGIGAPATSFRDLMDTSSSILTTSQTEAAINAESNESYMKFRKRMLMQVGGSKARRARLEQCARERDSSKGSDVKYGNSYINKSSEMSPDPCGSEVSGTTDNNSELEVACEDNLGEVAKSAESALEFRASMTSDMSNDATCSNSNGNDSDTGSVTKQGSSQSTEIIKDDAYWERRRKNNEAAKRSRDARRAKEDEIAIRAAFLEQENIKLRIELSSLKSETTKLRCLLYNS